jgi:hypothetical protein
MIVLLGHPVSLLSPLIQSHFHSELLSKLLASLWLLFWFLAYPLYLVIGIGLWKLHKWARRAVLAIHVLAIIACVVGSTLFVRPGALALAVLVGTAIPFGGIVWYLRWPNVRFAFGVGPAGYDPASVAPGFTKRRIWLVAIGVVGTLTLFVFTLTFAIEEMFRSSGVIPAAMRIAEKSPCIQERTGTPFTSGWGVTGNMQTSGENGSAELSIPVSGPKGSGSLDLEAAKQSGQWTVTDLEFSSKDGRLKVLPVPDEGCK